MTPGRLCVVALDVADRLIGAFPDLAVVLVTSEPNLPVDYLPGVISALATVEAASHKRALAIAQAQGARIPANRAERRGQAPATGRLILPGGIG